MNALGVVMTILGLILVAGVFATAIWSIRYHNRMFPRGFDRTGWNPDRERARWFFTKFTWLGGGRGPS